MFLLRYHVWSAVALYFHNGRVHTCCLISWILQMFTQRISALPSSVLYVAFKHGNAVKICNGKMFDFYLVLPHTRIKQSWIDAVIKDLQLEVTYPNFSYLNTSVIRMHLANPHPLFPATFVNTKLALAVQIANIECFRARSTRCIAAEDTV